MDDVMLTLVGSILIAVPAAWLGYLSMGWAWDRKAPYEYRKKYSKGTWQFGAYGIPRVPGPNEPWWKWF